MSETYDRQKTDEQKAKIKGNRLLWCKVKNRSYPGGRIVCDLSPSVEAIRYYKKLRRHKTAGLESDTQNAIQTLSQDSEIEWKQYISISHQKN